MPPFLAGLLLALTAQTGLSLYLSWRQINHVRVHRSAVPVDFAGTISLDAHQKAADYTITRTRLSTVETAVGLLISATWLLVGLDRLYGIVAGGIGAGLLRSVVFVIAFSAIGAVLDLPFGLYRTFVVEARFGFNRTTLARFITDGIKQAMLGLAVSVPLLFGLFWLMRHVAGLWWLYAWAGFIVISFGLSEAYPRWIAPLFNRFVRLEGSLRTRLEALLARCGFEAKGLFVMDASRRSAHGNAYFTGMGRAKRIVLFDTLIAQHTEDEIEAVLAHELGHFKHKDVLVTMARLALLSFVAFWGFAYLAGQRAFTTTLGFHHSDGAMVLTVWLLCLSALGPVFGFVGNWFSRRAEFRADAFAAQMVGADPLISALVKLSRDNASTLTPDPWHALFRYSHPPIPVRVEHLRRIDEKSRYVDRNAERHLHSHARTPAR